MELWREIILRMGCHLLVWRDRYDRVGETEIVEAVIRAVSPSLRRLRSYLEMIQDLSLSRLRQIMKAHFKRKSATEL